jgi:hypothetical protein
VARSHKRTAVVVCRRHIGRGRPRIQRDRMRLPTSVAVVTGAGSGLGYATAGRVIEAGGRVGLLDRDAELLAKAQAELGTAPSRCLRT